MTTPGGCIRIVVPDLGLILQKYNESVSELNTGAKYTDTQHAESLSSVFSQMVRIEPYAHSSQNLIVRIMERMIRGDAIKTGEAHRWMYDRYSLTAVLEEAGYNDVTVVDPATSRIDSWPDYQLDTDQNGAERKPGSIYIEATK